MKSIQNLAAIVMGIVMCLPMMALASDDCGVCEEPSDPTLQGGKPCSPKPDGTACTINGKPGKCCGGICYEVPGEGEDPCDWASANQGKFSQAIQDTVWGDSNCFGYVVCINGDTTECVIREHIEDQNPNWTQEMINCQCAHELDHLNSGANCPPCGYGVGTFPDDDTQQQGECSAFKAQWECLDDIEPETDAIRNAKAAYWEHMLNDLNCPIMPDPLI